MSVKYFKYLILFSSLIVIVSAGSLMVLVLGFPEQVQNIYFDVILGVCGLTGGFYSLHKWRKEFYVNK